MRKEIRNKLQMLLDILLINISVLSAYALRFDGGLFNIPRPFSDYIVHAMIAATIVKVAGFCVFKIYSSLWEYAGINEVLNIVKTTFICNLVLQGYVFLLDLRIPRSIFIIAFFIDMFLIGGARASYRLFRRAVMGEARLFKNFKKVLIVGGGHTASIIIKELRGHTQLSSNPVAIIDDDGTLLGRNINGVPIVGNTGDIVNVIEKYAIDEVIIALPHANKIKVSEILSKCSGKSCRVKILPSVTQLIDESVLVQKIRDVNIEDLLGREPVSFDNREIASYTEGHTILVTGGGGSIGSELCRQIAGYRPKQLIILDNYENNLYDIQNELLYSYPDLNLVPVIASIREKHRLDVIFSRYRPEIVFHAAAHKHVPLMEYNPTEAIKNNVFGTMNVADCADRFGVKKFVLISTDKAVNPTNIMGATKRIAEMIIQAINKYSKTEFVAVRFGNVLGSNGSVVQLFKRQIEQGGPVTVTHPDVIRYFMTIPEAVQLVMQAGAMGKGGEVFVLDMGQPVKIYDLARNLIKLSGFEPDTDIKIEFIGLRPGEKLYEELLLAEEGLASTINKKIFIAQPVFTDYAMLKKQIDYMKEIVMTDADRIFEYIQTIVPTYKKAQ